MPVIFRFNFLLLLLWGLTSCENVESNSEPFQVEAPRPNIIKTQNVPEINEADFSGWEFVPVMVGDTMATRFSLRDGCVWRFINQTIFDDDKKAMFFRVQDCPGRKVSFSSEGNKIYFTESNGLDDKFPDYPQRPASEFMSVMIAPDISSKNYLSTYELDVESLASCKLENDVENVWTIRNVSAKRIPRFKADYSKLNLKELETAEAVKVANAERSRQRKTYYERHGQALHINSLCKSLPIGRLIIFHNNFVVTVPPNIHEKFLDLKSLRYGVKM